MSFDRFHEAQAGRSAGYDTALAEIRVGRKSSHWIWYIFPQLAGLGHSSTARAYALRDLPEACTYLRDPLLAARYEEIARAVSEQLSRGVLLDVLMGSKTDVLKLVSSLTLFRAAAHSLADENAAFGTLAHLTEGLLQKCAAAGYPPCAFTLRELSGMTP